MIFDVSIQIKKSGKGNRVIHYKVHLKCFENLKKYLLPMVDPG